MWGINWDKTDSVVSFSPSVIRHWLETVRAVVPISNSDGVTCVCIHFIIEHIHTHWVPTEIFPAGDKSQMFVVISGYFSSVRFKSHDMSLIMILCLIRDGWLHLRASYPACQPQGDITLLSSIGDLKLIVVEACVERPTGLSQAHVHDALPFAHVLQQLWRWTDIGG